MKKSTNEINTGKVSEMQYAVQYQQNGNGGCIPIIDGKPEPSLMFGYATESDKAACLKLIGEALTATGGNIAEVQKYIMNAVVISANDIVPDEVVEVNGAEYLINYETKKAYDREIEIANLDDITCDMPNEAVKALLISRIQLELEQKNEPDYDDDYDDFEDDIIFF